MTSTHTQKNYFNLHITGIGYLNNIRLVEPKKGEPFYSCDISALVGESTKPEYRHFNCNVVGADTVNLIKRCIDAVTTKKKVLVSFVMSDLWSELFTYKTDSQYHKKGESGVALKGRLIRLKSITIDGELKYKEPPRAEQVAE